MGRALWPLFGSAEPKNCNESEGAVTATNIREALEASERENEKLRRELKVVTSERESWSFEDPEGALRKLTDIIRSAWDRSSREKTLTRLRAITAAFDTWQRLYRLNHDTEEMVKLRADIDEIRTMVERQSGRVILMPGVANGE